MSNLGDRFAQFRRAKGLSQAKLARELKTTQSAICAIENDGKDRLTPTTKYRLHERFPTLSIEWLETGAGEMFPPKSKDASKIQPSSFARSYGLGPNTASAFEKLCNLSQSEKDALDVFLSEDRAKRIMAAILGK